MGQGRWWKITIPKTPIGLANNTRSTGIHLPTFEGWSTRPSMEKEMKELSKTGAFAILLTSSLTIMVGTVIAPSLTEIARNLGFTANPGWLITLPSLGVVLFAPLMGKLIDKYGAYVVICGGLVPYAFIGNLGSLLHNPYLLIIDRLLLGAATAAVQASSTSMIADFFHGEKRMKMMARQGMSIEIGGVIFLSIGGILGEIHWKLPFLIYLIGVICLCMILLFVPQTDIVKEIGAVPARAPKKVITKEILGICISSMFAMLLFFVAFVGLPQYLPAAFGFSESDTGYFMSFISLTAVVFAWLMPKVSSILGQNHIVPLGFILFGIGLFCLSIATAQLVLLTAALAMGAGFGFTVPLLNHQTVEQSDATNRGKNLSYYAMGIFGGQFLSSFVGLLSSDIQTVFKIAATVAILVSITLFYRQK